MQVLGGGVLKINRQIIQRLCIGVSLLYLLIGCAMFPRERMASTASDYNIVVEKAQNQMLLLNIVRASRRYPMYFTSFNALRGNMSYDFSTGSISIPFGSIGTGFNGAYTVAPNVRYSSNPNFDLTVLDAQEFTRGIMTPVAMCTIDYYWKSGWPKELLQHLFIERIEIDKSEPLDNYPLDKEKFKKFQKGLRELTCDVGSKEHESISIKTKQEVGPKELIEAQKAGFEFISGKDGDENWYQLKLKQSEYIMECTNKDDSAKMATTKSKPGDEKIGRIYLRSPEAILYYLGELVRAETEGDFVPKVKVCKLEKEVPLFLIHKSTGTDSDAVVSVDFEGFKYSIPRDPLFADRCSADRTMQVLSLISQLIGQQKKIEQVPVTGVVNVIGR
jgi:hypothetical protein